MQICTHCKSEAEITKMIQAEGYNDIWFNDENSLDYDEDNNTYYDTIISEGPYECTSCRRQEYDLESLVEIVDEPEE